ncbi:LysE family transporter [Microbacterium gorillae]|uniref:LysE family transporter n=1 Tax=Microbacterium gorillae TaxID=1231063 RepID=UPI00058BCA01|nr:LysE family transporter [Microbacterium gorillae]
MPLSLWLTLLGATIVISFTPGAGAVFTMGNALNHGFRRAIWGILGQQTALIIHIIIVALGVGVLVASSEIAFNVIRYAGAAYLVFLGIRQIVQKPHLVEASGEPDRPKTPESRWTMFRRGVWVNLLNPKAIVFFLAFLPQFIRPDQPLLPQYLIVAATCVVVDIAVMWGFFAVAAHGFRRFTRTVRGQRTLNTIFGVLFIAVAGLLLFLH